MVWKPPSPLLRPLLILLPFALIVVLFLSSPFTSPTRPAPTTAFLHQTTIIVEEAQPEQQQHQQDQDHPSASSSSSSSPGIRIRPGYTTYSSYISKQLNKTLDPRLRALWTTRDWDRKVKVFSTFFSRLQRQGLLHNTSKSLCVGARVGQEVAALRSLGVADAVGIDLVPRPPLVIQGDFHNQPFPDATFDFEFSNVFDHALYPDRFVAEVERTLRPGGVCVLHVALRRRGDKYSANDLVSIQGLLGLFARSEVVEVRKVDGFGLDTEVVMRKKMTTTETETETETETAKVAVTGKTDEN